MNESCSAFFRFATDTEPQAKKVRRRPFFALLERAAFNSLVLRLLAADAEVRHKLWSRHDGREGSATLLKVFGCSRLRRV